MSAAHTASANGFTSNYGSWAYNPWFGLYTYLPGAGYGYSPFGWGFYSPYTVGYAYTPYMYGGGGSGYTGPVLSRVGSPVSSRTNAGLAAATAPARATPVAAAENAGIGESAPSIGSRSSIAAGGGSVGAAPMGGGAGGGGGMAARGASAGGGGGAARGR